MSSEGVLWYLAPRCWRQILLSTVSYDMWLPWIRLLYQHIVKILDQISFREMRPLPLPSNHYCHQGTPFPWRAELGFFKLVVNPSVGLDQMGYLWLPKCINQNPWLAMTLSLVHCVSFLGPLLLGPNNCTRGTLHKTCCFGDAQTESSRHYNLTHVKDIKTNSL